MPSPMSRISMKYRGLPPGSHASPSMRRLAKLPMNHWKREISMNEPNPPCELERHSEIQDAAPDPEEAYRLRERRETLNLNTAILRLRPRARRVVELHQLQEHSLRETVQ